MAPNNSASLTLEEEEKQVALLLAEVQAAGAWDETRYDVFALRRSLKARDWNVEAAKVVFLGIVQWRKDWEVDELLRREILTPAQAQRFYELFPHGLHGVDLQGRPIVIYRIGRCKYSELLQEFPELLRQKIHAQVMEFVTKVAMPACSLAHGSHIDRMTVIYDCAGIQTMSANSYAAVLTPPTKVTGAYYPETLGQLLIVNAPMVFDSLFSMSKGLLAPATQKKIKVFGSRNTKSGLAALIAPDQLPKDLGGTSTVPLGENWGCWSTLDKLPAAHDVVTSPIGVKGGKSMLRAAVDVRDVSVVAGADRHGSAFTRESNSSFHTCLSVAESAFLQSFMLQSGSRKFIPGLGNTMERLREEVSAIPESVIPESEEASSRHNSRRQSGLAGMGSDQSPQKNASGHGVLSVAHVLRTGKQVIWHT